MGARKNYGKSIVSKKSVKKIIFLRFIYELFVGTTSPTSGFEVSDSDFRKYLVELYKMYFFF